MIIDLIEVKSGAIGEGSGNDNPHRRTTGYGTEESPVLINF